MEVYLVYIFTVNKMIKKTLAKEFFRSTNLKVFCKDFINFTFFYSEQENILSINSILSYSLNILAKYKINSINIKYFLIDIH